MGLGGRYSLGKYFRVIIWGTSHKGVGPFFIGGVKPSRHQVNIFIWQLMRARLDEMVRNGAEKDFIFHAIFPAIYPFR